MKSFPRKRESSFIEPTGCPIKALEHDMELGGDMRLGVMSDTHGSVQTMKRAATRMIEEFGVERIIHLGDDLADARQMGPLSVELTAVPGVFEESYRDPRIPHRYITKIAGVRVLISHTPTIDSHDLPGDIDPEYVMKAGRAQVLLHGHTHIYRMERQGKGVAINPGHLKNDDKRGRPPSFAVIDIDAKKLKAQIIELDGGLLDEAEFMF